MESVFKYINEVPFDEIKDYKLILENDNGLRLYITLECLYSIFEKQYTKESSSLLCEILKLYDKNDTLKYLPERFKEWYNLHKKTDIL